MFALQRAWRCDSTPDPNAEPSAAANALPSASSSPHPHAAVDAARGVAPGVAAPDVAPPGEAAPGVKATRCVGASSSARSGVGGWLSSEPNSRAASPTALWMTNAGSEGACPRSRAEFALAELARPLPASDQLSRSPSATDGQPPDGAGVSAAPVVLRASRGVCRLSRKRAPATMRSGEGRLGPEEEEAERGALPLGRGNMLQTRSSSGDA